MTDKTMARRKESGLDIVATLPWPVGVVLGVLGFLAVRYGGLLFANSPNPILAGLGKALGNGALEPLAWVLMVACWLAALVSWLRGRKRAQLLDDAKGLDRIAAMSWREFEMLVGEAFRRQGYQVEELGGRGADGGIDLILRRGGETELVQCKQWRTRQVKVNVVREMWGLAQHHGAAAVRIVCVGDYTRDAEAFAADKPIALINGARLIALVQEAQGVGANAARIEPTFETAEPTCPACGEAMIARHNRKTGTQFWGCSKFPACRGTRA